MAFSRFSNGISPLLGGPGTLLNINKAAGGLPPAPDPVLPNSQGQGGINPMAMAGLLQMIGDGAPATGGTVADSAAALTSDFSTPQEFFPNVPGSNSSGVTASTGSPGGGITSFMSPWSALLAAAAGLSIGSLSKGHDNQNLNTADNMKQTFGGEGWGGPPMMALQNALDGDFKGTARNIGGTDPFGPMNAIGTLAGGGNIEDIGKNMAAPFLNLMDIGKNGNSFLDMINIFSSPGMAR